MYAIPCCAVLVCANPRQGMELMGVLPASSGEFNDFQATSASDDDAPEASRIGIDSQMGAGRFGDSAEPSSPSSYGLPSVSVSRLGMQLPPLIAGCMSTCHALAHLDGTLIGD